VNAAKQLARFLAVYDTPSDVEAFERPAEDPQSNLARYTTFRGIILQLDLV